MTSNKQVVLKNVACKRDLNFLFSSFNLLHPGLSLIPFSAPLSIVSILKFFKALVAISVVAAALSAAITITVLHLIQPVSKCQPDLSRSPL